VSRSIAKMLGFFAEHNLYAPDKESLLNQEQTFVKLSILASKKSRKQVTSHAGSSI